MIVQQQQVQALHQPPFPPGNKAFHEFYKRKPLTFEVVDDSSSVTIFRVFLLKFLVYYISFNKLRYFIYLVN